jgi:4-amino-4-deoxy-L-arabinose transferase
MMGNALIERLKHGQSRALRMNGLVNAVLGLIALVAVLYLQFKQPVYENEPMHLLLAIIVLVGWVLTNALQGFRPLTFWAMPALGSWLLVALLPAALPNTVVHNKTPDQFIARHVDELAATRHLLSNDLGAASALAWRLKRPNVALLNTRGELDYGLGYPDVNGRAIGLDEFQSWMTQARREGAVGVVIRTKGDDELHELDLLPKEGKRYDEGNLVILIFERSAS